MTRMDPSQIGRPAGGTVPAPQGGDASPLDGIDLLSAYEQAVVDTALCDAPVEQVTALRLEVLRRMGVCPNPECDGRGRLLSAPNVGCAVCGTAAQPPRPAAVADEDVRRALVYANERIGMDPETAAFMADERMADRGSSAWVRAIVEAALAAPAPRDPARDAGEAERDTARLDWLESTGADLYRADEFPQPERRDWRCYRDGYPLTGSEYASPRQAIDAAIDAARRAEPGEGAHG